jgi:hypothetical protein
MTGSIKAATVIQLPNISALLVSLRLFPGEFDEL